MAKRRKVHEASFKAPGTRWRVALEAVKERETAAQLAKRFAAPPTQVHQWKRKLREEAAEVFDGESRSRPTETFETAQLYEQDQRCASVPAGFRWSWTG